MRSGKNTISKPDAKTIRRGLRRLDLQAYYAAVNERYFGGKLPKGVKVSWKSQKQLERMKGVQRRNHLYGFCGFDRKFNQKIVLNIDAHVSEPHELLRTMVHEAIHIRMPFGDELKRKSSYADTTITHHGEMFGAECRRINELLGYKLMSDQECSYGIAGRKWAYDNVVIECDEYDYADECGIDTAVRCEVKGTKREVRKHQKEHRAKQDAWNEKYGDKWDEEKMDFIDGRAHAYDDFKHEFIKSHPNDPIILDDDHIVRLWKARKITLEVTTDE
jgi:SprT-like family